MEARPRDSIPVLAAGEQQDASTAVRAHRPWVPELMTLLDSPRCPEIAPSWLMPTPWCGPVFLRRSRPLTKLRRGRR